MRHLIDEEFREDEQRKSFANRQGRRWGVILAGGDGTRLRSLTQRIAGDERPKQFCPILGRETLLDQTRRRVALKIPDEQTLIVVTKAHERFYAKQLPSVPRERLVIQPANQGTAPAILYSLLRLDTISAEDVVAFFPSDHYFANDGEFMAHIESAFRAVEHQPEMTVLLGITPTGPEVDYGWIEPVGSLLGQLPGSVSRVRRFWEKPSRTLAQTLFERGCLWNSFVMVGRVSTFLDLIRRAVPDLYQIFVAVKQAIGTTDEERTMRALYGHISPSNFSQEVLAMRPSDLHVLRVHEVGWSDWGEPGRVLSTLASIGVQAEWAMTA